MNTTDNRRELDGIFAALDKANLVVMDCRAASTDLFIDYFAEIDLPAVLSAMGAALTLVMPVNHESDSVGEIIPPCGVPASVGNPTIRQFKSVGVQVYP